MGKQAEFSVRGSRSGTTRRMRVYSLHDDQVELIQAALELARQEAESEYDSVALTCICMAYLASAPVKLKPSRGRRRDHGEESG